MPQASKDRSGEGCQCHNLGTESGSSTAFLEGSPSTVLGMTLCTVEDIFTIVTLDACAVCSLWLLDLADVPKCRSIKDKGVN